MDLVCFRIIWNESFEEERKKKMINFTMVTIVIATVAMVTIDIVTVTTVTVAMITITTVSMGVVRNYRRTDGKVEIKIKRMKEKNNQELKNS